MTTYHCERARIRLALAFLLVASPAIAFAEERAGWSLGYSDSEGLHKLVYGKPETEGEVYLRCIAGSGWVFLIHDYEPKRGKPPPTLTAGAGTVSPSFRVEYDDVISDGFYVDIALPANHDVLKGLAEGQPLQFEGVTYPVRTDVERRSIRNFITVCEGDG
jgi:hypothetical protein